MNKKILVIPNSLENLSDILKTNVDGIILSIKDLSVNSNVYFTIDDIKSIINITSKEVCVSINKIMHNEDLKLLEEQGVEILTCGTCLNYYNLSDKLQVGSVTNMYTIVEKMAGADKIITP